VTAYHILQVCPTYATLRRKHWPKDTAATEKLYGAREELQRTAAFIFFCNVLVQSFREKNIFITAENIEESLLDNRIFDLQKLFKIVL
jgi:hypothetical protein